MRDGEDELVIMYYTRTLNSGLNINPYYMICDYCNTPATDHRTSSQILRYAYKSRLQFPPIYHTRFDHRSGPSIYISVKMGLGLYVRIYIIIMTGREVSLYMRL